MVNNTTATDLVTQNIKYKVAGTTLASSIIQRFSHNIVNNGLEYTSSVARVFKISFNFTLTAPSNNAIRMFIGIDRNGLPIDPSTDFVAESQVSLTTSGTRPDTGSTQCLVQLNEGDIVYPIVQNTSGSGDVTVNSLNIIITPLS
jgi:hypothetical protein